MEHFNSQAMKNWVAAEKPHNGYVSYFFNYEMLLSITLSDKNNNNNITFN